MREEDKEILIRTYQNTIVELELGAEKLKEAGNNAWAHQLEDVSQGLQKSIAVLQGKVEYPMGEWGVVHLHFPWKRIVLSICSRLLLNK